MNPQSYITPLTVLKPASALNTFAHPEENANCLKNLRTAGFPSLTTYTSPANLAALIGATNSFLYINKALKLLINHHVQFVNTTFNRPTSFLFASSINSHEISLNPPPYSELSDLSIFP